MAPPPPEHVEEAVAEGLAAVTGLPIRVAGWELVSATEAALSEDEKSFDQERLTALSMSFASNFAANSVDSAGTERTSENVNRSGTSSGARA